MQLFETKSWNFCNFLGAAEIEDETGKEVLGGVIFMHETAEANIHTLMTIVHTLWQLLHGSRQKLFPNGGALKTVNSVYDSDCFEIFIADGEDPKRTYHFITDHSGRIRAADSKGSCWNWNWEHHAKITAKKESDRWIVDFEMPLSDARVTDPSNLRFTIIRNRHAGGRWQILGTPAGGAFFDIARYIRVKPAPR